MKVTLPDGTDLTLDDGATGADAAAAIGAGLARAALAVRVDGELRDLSRPLPDGAKLEIVTNKDPGALELIRHDAALVPLRRRLRGGLPLLGRLLRGLSHQPLEVPALGNRLDRLALGLGLRVAVVVRHARNTVAPRHDV